MRIAICDDQRVYREDILEHCKRLLPEGNVCYRCFASGEELLDSGFLFDLLFLDIEMTGMDGIQVKNLLEMQNTQAKIAFLTSHEERMIEAFGANVIGFLQKPVQEEKLLKVIEKMKLFLDRETVEWEDDGRLHTVYAEDIQYIEVQDKYTYVVVGEDKHLVRRSLTEWEALLPESDFARANRSCLVNLCLLERLNSEIRLEDGKTIPIGRRYKKEIEEKYKRYLRKQMERM